MIIRPNAETISRRLKRRVARPALALLTIALVVGCSQQRTDDPRRHVALDGQPNFRDLGGYETADGRTVKWGQVYRSGELGGLSDDDVAKLKELGLRTNVNFLLPEEVEKHGRDRLPEGAKEVSKPITDKQIAELSLQAHASIKSGDFEKLPPEMNPEFHRLLLEAGKKEYAAMLRAAADPEQRPLVFHCSHGVHRTGTGSAILLSALGVPWETIRQDYVLSNTYRATENAKELARIREMVAKQRGVSPDEVDMANVKAFFILQTSYIDGTREQAIKRYGSMEAYIRDGLGISDEEVAELRRQLLKD